ncbi:M56 family metallopeptidase [Prauserella muralis]|uniref:Peptidase M56 domain-containing protein n=1 Tax=Prauserella muralis TaxID=588067 RepID=A0A2V4B318_9PSEU|nr:M56 family metallopeptidase [Prauserella muralis]PXY22865.1 hypothetical protein BAY60_24115 [Prauserella muralis]TWE28623.1 Zn-dependent protease with chaperone function [Prauserella muralis]
MSRDWPLFALVTAAVASYPALVLSGCVLTLLSGKAAARELWLDGHPGALLAPVLAGVSAIAVVNAARVLARGLWHTHRFHRWIAGLRTPAPSTGLARPGALEGVQVIPAREPLAVTVGLWRPYVVVSSGLVAELSEQELRAVLAHEQAHVRRRDPLRLLLGRTLAAHLWFLPVAADLRGRARRGYELAADRHAAKRCGRAAVAGALLRVAALPPASPAFAAHFAGPELLDARVSQLESGRPPRPAAISRRRAALTVAGGLVFALVVAAAWTFMLLTCPCVMPLQVA